MWARSAYLVEIVPGESDTRKLIARRGFFANKIANATAVKAKEGGGGSIPWRNVLRV